MNFRKKIAERNFKIGFYLSVYMFLVFLIRLALIEGDFHYADLFHHISISSFLLIFSAFMIPAVFCYICKSPKILCSIMGLFLIYFFLFLDTDYSHNIVWSVTVYFFGLVSMFIIFSSRKYVSYKGSIINRILKKILVFCVILGYGEVVVNYPFVWLNNNSIEGAIEEYIEYRHLVAEEEAEIIRDEDYKRYARAVTYSDYINGDYYLHEIPPLDYSEEELDKFYMNIREKYKEKEGLYNQIKEDVSQRALKCHQNTYKISDLEGFVDYAPTKYGEGYWENLDKIYNESQEGTPWGEFPSLRHKTFNRLKFARGLIEDECIDFAVQEYIQEKEIQKLLNKNK